MYILGVGRYHARGCTCLQAPGSTGQDLFYDYNIKQDHPFIWRFVPHLEIISLTYRICNVIASVKRTGVAPGLLRRPVYLVPGFWPKIE